MTDADTDANRPQEDASDASSEESSGPDTPSGGTAGTTPRPASEGNGRADDIQQEIEQRYHELEERYDAFRDSLEDYNESAQSFIRRHPVACIAGALGTGYVLGRLAARRWLK